MKIELLLVACAYVGVSSLTTPQVSTSEDSSSSTVRTTTTVATTARKSTTPGVIIVVPTVRTVNTPPPRQTVFTCEAVTLECPNKYTVAIDVVYHGRRRDPSCTTGTPDCCPTTRNDTTDCYERKDSLLSVQQEVCKQYPGRPCPILSPNGLPIAGCGSAELQQSYFRMIVFHCIYIPTTTSNETTVPETSTMPTETQTTTTPITSTISSTQETTKLAPSTQEKLPIGIIAGAAGGGVFLILLIVLIICCHRRRRQRIKREDMTKANPGVIPVKDIKVNYMDAEKANQSDPDIIKTVMY